MQKLLDEYLGESLLSIDTEQVEQKLNVHPKLEMVEVVKKFPNVLCVNLKERREVYKLEYNDKTYILDEFGFVLTDDGKTTQGTSLISLSFEKINIAKIVVGMCMSRPIEPIREAPKKTILSDPLDMFTNKRY